MFAGKTEELLRRVRRAVIGGQSVQVLTHALDTREGTDRGRFARRARLPVTGGGVGDEFHSAWRKARVMADPPQERVRVERQPHSSFDP